MEDAGVSDRRMQQCRSGCLDRRLGRSLGCRGIGRCRGEPGRHHVRHRHDHQWHDGGPSDSSRVASSTEAIGSLSITAVVRGRHARPGGRCGPWTAKLALSRPVARGSCGAAPITAVTSASMRAWSMVWAALRMRSSTSAALRASRISSGADWSRATVRCVLSRSPLDMVSLTIAGWPLQREQPSKPCYLHHPVERHSPAMRRAEGLDVSSFAAQDACAAEQPPPAKRSPCRPARQKPRQRIQSKGWRWRPLGVHRLHREWVRREAEVESHVLIDYFLRESLGAHQHRQGHPERGGDPAWSGRCLRRVNHGARTAPRRGRG